MPLTKSQRQKVRRIKIYEFFASKEGKKVLEFDELRALVFTELSKLGCRYELSSPDAANCVIRVFRNKSISCSNGKFCCYGAQCFTRNGNKKKWVGVIFESIEIADFAPIPLTDNKSSNILSSSFERKPYKLILSSLT